MPRPQHLTRAGKAGFSLIELLCVLAMLGVLSSIAYPAFIDQLRSSRRADALTAVVTVQQSQGQYRSRNLRYASLAELGLADTSAAGHYRLSVQDPGVSGYVLLAQAAGVQQADSHCRFLQLVVDGLNTRTASGPNDQVANPAAANLRCWSQ